MQKLLRLVILLSVAASLSACSIGKGIQLAVDCDTDQAIAVIEKAEKGSGMSREIAILEMEAILLDAGRIDEAEAVRAKRESQSGLSEKEKADAEKAILDTMENIRNERKKKTGSATCP